MPRHPQSPPCWGGFGWGSNPIMQFFKFSEFSKSATAERLGIDNTIPAEWARNIADLVSKVLDPARARIGCPIYINSGYRCKALNKAVGGARSSQHMYGLAADITTRDRATNARLADIIKRELPFDQLIYYDEDGCGPAFLHVSVRADGSDIPNRHQVLHKCSK